ncbi:MAG: dTDP-4-dehydrorhamnose reductase [Acidimicrobiia bacterium]
MRILITGAAGQLGADLVKEFDRPHHEVIACDRSKLDLSSRDSVLQAITTVEPDAIVHAGAWTAVDACESDPDRAFQVNALGTRHVADGARTVGARVLYVSTDYVFDGSLDRPYNEWDFPNPQSVYGHSKLAGERELDPGSTIVRCSWVCGYHGNNMVKTVLKLSAERDRLEFVDDQRGSPTFTADLAAAIYRLVVGKLPGTFHVTNQGATTWFEFVREIVRLAGRDPGIVHPIKTADLQPPRPAKRPANSVLDNAALRLQGLPLLPVWQESLERLVKELVA